MEIFLLFVIGIFFWCGKGSFLIAGYNTASKKEKEKYNEKNLKRCIACTFWGFAILQIAEKLINKDWFSDYVIPLLMILIIIILFIVSNTYCKRK